MSTTNEQTSINQPQPKKGRGRPSKNAGNVNVVKKTTNQTNQMNQLNNNNGGNGNVNGNGNGNGNVNVNNINNGSNNNSEENSNSTSSNTKRKSIMDSLLDQESEQTISSELQNLAIEQFGQDVFQKAFEMSHGSLSLFRIYKLKKPNEPIPPNWHTDDYWMYSPDERVEMLNAAFEIQDDDADLKNTVEGEFKCSACKSKRIRLRLRQIRSSDEAMSQFFKCADCKKEWVSH